MEIVRKLLGENCNGEPGRQKSGLDDWKHSISERTYKYWRLSSVHTICEYEKTQRILPPFYLIP
jgi:hypothetical protein